MTDVTLTTGPFAVEQRGVRRTGTALILPDGMAYEDWYDLGQQLQAAEAGVQWWLGDWLNFGEPHYGEKYAQAVDPSQAKTWKDYATVAARYETSERSDILSWSHHRVVAWEEPKARKTGVVPPVAI